MRGIIAPVHSAGMRFARESAGYATPEEAANALPASLKKDAILLADWEAEKQPLTVSKAKALAKFYHRPLTFLYLRNIPADMKDAQPRDFRRGDLRRPFSPNLRLLLRQSGERQKWAREFLRDSPESGRFSPPPGFGARPADAEKLGEELRHWLGIDGGELKKMRRRNDALEYWRRQAETRGVIVLQSHRHPSYQIGVGEFSGCAMADGVAPTVVLNSDEPAGKRIFTLAHELAHLWIAKPGLSCVSFRADAFAEGGDEAYCNRAAAAALLPRDVFLAMWQNTGGDAAEKTDSIAGICKVSNSAVAVRAAREGFVSRAECEKMLKEYAGLAKKAAKKKSGGRTLPDRQALQRAGGYFAGLTLDAFERGGISAPDVSDLLGVKLDHLGKIAERMHFPLHRWARR